MQSEEKKPTDSLFSDQELWLSALQPAHRDLVLQARELYQREVGAAHVWHDYAFVVFPMAKAYEGFLKTWLLEQGLLDQATYRSRRFRIGRALNPDVPPAQRDDFWLYDDLVQRCSKVTARQLWETWLECRNHTFHFFPENSQTLNLESARIYLNKLALAIEAATMCSQK